MEDVEVLRVFTDGSSSKNGKKNCTSGCGVFYPDQDVKLSLTSQEASDKCGIELEGHSNNIGELLGILVALVHVTDKTRELMIYTDSMYCINSLSVWYRNWKLNGWKTAEGKPVKNKNLIMKILEEKTKFRSVFLVHSRGHQREPLDKSSVEWFLWYGNDIADELATRAVHGSNKA
jgi:ribonuclease HI